MTIRTLYRAVFLMIFCLRKTRLRFVHRMAGFARTRTAISAWNAHAAWYFPDGPIPQTRCLREGGSFWTNDTLPLLDLSPEQDPRLNPRNRCIHEGYRSVALIPIRTNRNIVGLLQLNDRESGSFTLDLITYFEGLGTSIGIALSFKRGGVAWPLSSGSSTGMVDAIPQCSLLR